MRPGGLCRRLRSSGGTILACRDWRAYNNGRQPPSRCAGVGASLRGVFRQGTRMHTTARTTVRVGAWVAVLAVLAAGMPAGPAAAQDTKSDPGKASPDKKYAFEFDKRPWR